MPTTVAPPASNEHVRKTMQGNKRANTKPELLMRERLRAAGLTGYRLQWKVPGRPDICWPGKRVALFVNGCFWHRCPHCQPSSPKSHVEYWMMKFERNVERDRRNLELLRAEGWRVHVVWECQLKKKVREETLATLFSQLSEELGKPLSAEAPAVPAACASGSGDAPASGPAAGPASNGATGLEPAPDSATGPASDPASGIAAVVSVAASAVDSAADPA
ncbi:very short patch repair endonuclease [Berryella wangjianweii]|uniref:very short patch repair endonuclease n=1 Tax=Berryella wangjianweii TaxID=2734634 RepID=UPI0021BD4A24|nr:DNA mismatch endonuclease Vsr [Berryella wangjianweii]